jgi:hypothetical protein
LLGFLGPPLLVPPEDDVGFLPACDNAEPAALFAAVLVRPSLSTFDALVAADGEVTLVLPFCESALPAADFEAAPVDGLFKTPLADFAALPLVDLVAIRACSDTDDFYCCQTD